MMTQSVAILAQVTPVSASSFIFLAMSPSPRPCNVGPIPPCNEEKLACNLRHVIDSTSRDAEIFEWGSIAGVSKGGAIPYAQLAEKSHLVISHLDAAPSGRISETVLRRTYNSVITSRPMRAIFPNIPRPDLVKLQCKIVRDWKTCGF